MLENLQKVIKSCKEAGKMQLEALPESGRSYAENYNMYVKTHWLGTLNYLEG